MRSAAARSLGTAAAVCALASCSGARQPVVTVTAVPTGSTDACARFAAKLPDSLGSGLDRRTVEPNDSHVAAYGEPPVVVRCGAPRTTKYEPGDQLFTLNGVAWFPDERPDVVVWSLPRAFVNVEVTIPRRWTGDRLTLLTDAVRAAGVS